MMPLGMTCSRDKDHGPGAESVLNYERAFSGSDANS